MSMISKQAFDAKFLPPEWTKTIPIREYHNKAYSGQAMSAGMLKEFRKCPSHYHLLVTGQGARPDSDAFRLGRAIHTLVLEGEAEFRHAYVIGGPINDRTGKAYSPSSKAYADWLEESGFDKSAVLNSDEAELALRIRNAVLAHPEAARILAQGWPERTVEAKLQGFPCQARIDWLRPDGVAVDLKTTDDITWFENDARRYGYLHQFAFYREVVRAASGNEPEFLVAVAEKRPPHRIGVWKLPPETLDAYAQQNRQALDNFLRCRESGNWPTGYEKVRSFPASGLPPFWLN